MYVHRFWFSPIILPVSAIRTSTLLSRSYNLYEKKEKTNLLFFVSCYFWIFLLYIFWGTETFWRNWHNIVMQFCMGKGWTTIFLLFLSIETFLLLPSQKDQVETHLYDNKIIENEWKTIFLHYLVFLCYSPVPLSSNVFTWVRYAK